MAKKFDEKVFFVNDHHITQMSSIKPKEIEWLLFPYIPMGEVTVIEGEPNTGKTTLALQIVAAVTYGKPVFPTHPELSKIKDPLCVIFQNSDDGLEDVILPRLITAGADLSKISFLDENKNSLFIDDYYLDDILEKTQAKILVFDPIQAYIKKDVDINNAREMQPLITKLSILAKKHNCAVILIGRFGKSYNEKDTYKSLGCLDSDHNIRSVLRVEKNDSEYRTFKQVKNSLAACGSTQIFTISDDGLLWHDIKEFCLS